MPRFPTIAANIEAMTPSVYSMVGKKAGEWKGKIVKKLTGRREAGVVTVLSTSTGRIYVLTVEWEDL